MGTSLTNQEGESRTYRVQGRARDAKGLPASQIKVAVFDTDLRSEQLLGEAVTDEGGITGSNIQRAHLGGKDGQELICE